MPHFLYVIIQWFSVNLLEPWTGGWAPVSKQQYKMAKIVNVVKTQGDPKTKPYSDNADRQTWTKIAYLQITMGSGMIAFKDFSGRIRAKFNGKFKAGEIIKIKEGYEPCEFFILGKTGDEGGKLRILDEFTPNSYLPDGRTKYPEAIEV